MARHNARDLVLSSIAHVANGAHRARKLATALSDGAGNPFDAQEPLRRRSRRARETRRHVVGQVRGAGYARRRTHGRRHGGDRGLVVEAETARSVASAGGARQHLEGDLGHDAERAPGAGQQLAQIVAGDVLDHAAARTERLAAARHRHDASK